MLNDGRTSLLITVSKYDDDNVLYLGNIIIACIFAVQCNGSVKLRTE